MQYAGVGLQHDREPSQAELRQLQLLFQHGFLHGVVHVIHHHHVAMNGHAVGHVAQTRLVRIHEVRTRFFLFLFLFILSRRSRNVVVNDGLAK